MIFNRKAFILSCMADFDKAAHSDRHSKRWQNDMARRSGELLGRFYALYMTGVYDSEVAEMPTTNKRPNGETARILAILAKDPEYAEKIKIRV